ncbi:MAG TPA: 1-(5-phosphoribosyl)-5-[(5-phosphoribosylamino)methylideneamino] imidazole-4-carboxamide isomerase [Gaiellaceae bacterium]
MDVIPAIDLLGREAIRLEQGDYARVSRYGEPHALARRFAAEGAQWIHVVDLDGARAGLIRPVVVSALVHASTPAWVQASGGIRSVADAETLVRAGASRVVVGTAAWRLLDELVASLGERLVVALDVRDGVVRTRGWTEEGLALFEAIDRCLTAGVSRLLCTAIERDGTLEGPDVDLVRRVVERSRLPVLAAGGIRSGEDLDALKDAGAQGAIVGRALLEGRIQIGHRA